MNKNPDRPPYEDKMWQYRNIIDAAIDGLIITDLETGCVVEANPAACQMHGYPRDEFIGMHLSAYIHPDSQNLFNLYIRAFQTDKGFDTRVIHQRRDGSTFFGEWRGSPFATFGGVPVVGQFVQFAPLLEVHQV